MGETVALRVRDLCKAYGSRPAVDRVSFVVREGAVTVLVGPNGSGKTTVLECLEGLRNPDSGQVEILGEVYSFGRKRPPAMGVQLQEESLPARIKVCEAFELFRRLYRAPQPRQEIIELLGVTETWNRRFGQLSGGEKRRVVVALATLGSPRLVVLDEPTSGLDPGGQESVLRLIELLRISGTAVLATFHALDQAADIGDEIGVLHQGRLVEFGRPRQLIDGLGVTSCLSLPCAVGMPAAALATLRVRRHVVHADRQYFYGGQGMLDAVAAAGGPAGLVPTAEHQMRVELRSVSLVDVFLSSVGAVAEMPGEVRTG